MTDTPYDHVLPPIQDGPPTPVPDPRESPAPSWNFTQEDLGLIRRVLDFAVAQIGIEDAMGNKIYPKTETRQHAMDLINRMEAQGVTVPKGLYTPFDPYEIRDKVATARWFDPDNYEHSIKGLITGVDQDEETERWYIRFGTTVFDYADRAEVNSNVFVDLVDNQ